MLQWSLPKLVKSLRGFLGLVGYYKRFIKEYGKIARPLTNMLQKGNFNWTQESSQAFCQLKQALTTTLVLAMSEFSQPFSIECDASDKEI